MKAIKVSTGADNRNTVSVIDIDLNSLEAIYKAIDCDFIEVSYYIKGAIIICSETGKLDGKLPVLAICDGWEIMDTVNGACLIVPETDSENFEGWTKEEDIERYSEMARNFFVDINE